MKEEIANNKSIQTQTIEPMSLALSYTEVKQKITDGLVNLKTKNKTKSIKNIIRDNCFTVFNIINCFFALIILILSIKNVSYVVNLSFMGLVISNTIIGIYQEIKAKHIIDKLSLVNEAKVVALREDREEIISIYDIVVGDVLMFSAGQQIPVDGELILAKDCEFDESLLTGESNSIQKEMGDSVLSRTNLLTGKAYIKVNKVGENTYMGKLEKIIASTSKTKSQIMVTLNIIVKVLSVLLLPLALGLLFSQFFPLYTKLDGNFTAIVNNPSFDRIILSIIAACVGIIPEGLVLLTSISFAVSVTRLGMMNNMLVQTLPAIESLARIDVLCLDKTGTITTGAMNFKDLIQLEEASKLNYSQAYLRTLIASFVKKAGENSKNATQHALEAEFLQPELSYYEALDFLPFQSIRKYAGMSFKEEKDAFFMLGASENILENEKDTLKTLQKKINLYSQQGLRVLLFAVRKQDKTLPLALLLIQDELRQGAEKMLTYFEEQGVRTVLISGDSVHTVGALAKQVNFRRHDLLCDCSKLDDDISLEEIGKLLDKYQIFGRVKPKLKQKIIKSLINQKHYVAMTGDGINDVPALKEAHCSLAMVSGSEAARASSDFVLLDNNLESLIPAVYEGRRVINNIENVSSLFLNKTCYALLLGFAFLFIKLPFPLIPIQITLLSVFTIGVPSFFLALKGNKERVRGEFSKRICIWSLPSGVAISSCIIIHVLLASRLQIPTNLTLQISPILLASGSFLLLFQLMRKFSILKALLFAFCLGGFITTGFVFKNFLKLGELFSYLQNPSYLSYLLSLIFLNFGLIMFFQFLQNKLNIHEKISMLRRSPKY